MFLTANDGSQMTKNWGTPLFCNIRLCISMCKSSFILYSCYPMFCNIHVCLAMVVISPKPFMGAATFSFINNQTRETASVHSMKSSQQATKHGTPHPVLLQQMQPNTPPCMVQALLSLAGMTTSSWTKTPWATNHACWRFLSINFNYQINKRKDQYATNT